METNVNRDPTASGAVTQEQKMKIERIQPGRYIIEGAYEVNRTHEGSLHSGDVAWYWRPVGPDRLAHRLFDTKAEAIADLKQTIGGGL